MKAQLLAIDDVTLFPLKGEDVLLLFKTGELRSR